MKQIQRFVRLLWQIDCRDTAKINDVFNTSASAILLPITLLLKFECCILFSFPDVFSLYAVYDIHARLFQVVGIKRFCYFRVFIIPYLYFYLCLTYTSHLVLNILLTCTAKYKHELV